MAPLVLLHGDEPLQMQEGGDAVRAAARAAGAEERSVHTLGGPRPDWSAALGDVQSPSLFAARRLIEWRIPGKPGKDGGEALQKLAGADDPDVFVLVTLPRLDRQQQQSAWFAAVAAKAVVVAVQPIERRALPAWLAQRLAAQGQRVLDGAEGAQTLDFMADRVEGNLLAAHQEVLKLGLLHPPGQLTFDDVRTAVLNVARYDVAHLAEAVLAGQAARALRVLHGLKAEGEAAALISWSLADDVRALKRVHQAVERGRPLALALREQRVWGAKEKWFEVAVPRLDRAEVDALVADAATVDGIVKGLRRPGWPQEPWLALERLVLKMLQAVQASDRAFALEAR